MRKAYSFRPFVSREVAAIAVFLEAMHEGFGAEFRTCKELVIFGDAECPEVTHLLTDADKFEIIHDRAQALGRQLARAAALDRPLGGFVLVRQRNERGNYTYGVQKVAIEETAATVVPRAIVDAMAAGDVLALAEVARELDELMAHWIRLRPRIAEALGAARARR